MDSITPRSPSPPWSDLPPELLSQIAHFLHNSSIDLLGFRAVCHSFHSSFSLPNPPNFRFLSPNLPIKLNPHPVLSQPVLYTFAKMDDPSFYLTATTSFLLHPIHQHPFGNSSSLLTFDEINPCKLCFPKPLYELYNSSLGQNSSPLLLDLLNFHVLVVSEHFVVRHLCVRQNASKKNGTGLVLEPSVLDKKLSAKAIVMWDLSLALVLSPNGGLEVIGLKDKDWRMRKDGNKNRCYNDIVKFSNENIVYGIDRNGAVNGIRIHPKSYKILEIPISTRIVGSNHRRKRLVADSSSNRLYLIESHVVQSKIAFKVYKLDLSIGQNSDEELQKWEKISTLDDQAYNLDLSIGQNSDKELQKWEKITTLDDRVLFVDIHFSMCLSPQDFCKVTRNCPHFIPRNCIFFTRGSFPKFGGFSYSDDNEFFQGEGTHLNVGMFCLEDDYAVGLMEPDLDALFAPPITWFQLQPQPQPQPSS